MTQPWQRILHSQVDGEIVNRWPEADYMPCSDRSPEDTEGTAWTCTLDVGHALRPFGRGFVGVHVAHYEATDLTDEEAEHPLKRNRVGCVWSVS
jgi:hypothetical protein